MPLPLPRFRIISRDPFLTSKALRFEHSQITFLTIRITIFDHERFSEGPFFTFREGFRIDERVAAGGAEEMESVVGPRAGRCETFVGDGDEFIGCYGGFAMIARCSVELKKKQNDRDQSPASP